VTNTAEPLLKWRELHHAWGGPVLRAGFRQQPGDFRVDEDLGFEPDGAGEHLFVAVEKTQLTTFEAQAILARHFGVPLRDTAFAGMKDKAGVTCQWFSLRTPRPPQAAEALQHPQLRVLRSVRNSRKLRRGTHKGNTFRIVLRNPAGERTSCAARVQTLAQRGVPNYFGVQRFGRNEDNVAKALAWFRGDLVPQRQERSILLSAARSYLFNVRLSARVQNGTWNNWIDGDLMQLAGTGSVFASQRATPADLQQRLQDFDIHATAPLWGSGALKVTGEALVQESALAQQHPELTAGLAAHGLAQERRALRLQVHDLRATFHDDNLLLEFGLERGAYATAVLRELLMMEEG
jgi:tRNA pseudouridine13 synthase